MATYMGRTYPERQMDNSCYNCGLRPGVRTYEAPSGDRIRLCGSCAETFGSQYGGYVPLLEEPAPAPVEPELLSHLTSEELTALADLNARNARIWSELADRGHSLKSSALTPSEVAEHYRERARHFKELAAAEEQAQTDYEEAEGK